MRLFLLILALVPTAATAHAGRQSFVLLLPTQAYITAGVASVALTLLLITIVPARKARALFATIPLKRSQRPRTALTSTLSFMLLAMIIAAGLAGSTDPTRNPIPAYLWTLIWIVAVLVQTITGTFWRYITPWTAPLRLMRHLGLHPTLPLRCGHWPALVSLAGFAWLLLVSPRASDPPTLALVISAYWFVHFLGGLIFGPKWLTRAEAITVLMQSFGRLAPIRHHQGRLRIGLPGWHFLARPAPSLGLAIFMVGLLAMGSFDGLYRTFTWFAWTGQNPLEFTGRSTVIGLSTMGLAAALPLLFTLYAACLWLGLALTRHTGLTGQAIRAFAPALLPIAAAYHLAHYLPTLLIEAQSLPIILNDPLGTGANFFGWDHLQVTTGLFNRLDTVRVIWLTQAGAVVAGHALAIAMSHVAALRLLPNHRSAALSQLPIATLMIGYTLFGLWLLATPQGV